MVPDNIMLKLLQARLSQDDCKVRGWVLRGFPRTRAQAVAWKSIDIEVNRVVKLDLPEELAVVRLCKRRFDISATGAANGLVQHPDDAEAAVLKRYMLYAEQIEDIADVYQVSFYIPCDTFLVTAPFEKKNRSKSSQNVQRIGAHSSIPAVFELIGSNSNNNNNNKMVVNIIAFHQPCLVL